jgi:hypothetical protein
MGISIFGVGVLTTTSIIAASINKLNKDDIIVLDDSHRVRNSNIQAVYIKYYDSSHVEGEQFIVIDMFGEEIGSDLKEKKDSNFPN